MDARRLIHVAGLKLPERFIRRKELILGIPAGLRRISETIWELPPYETITREDYEAMQSELRPLRGELPHEEELESRFCEGGVCEAADY